MNYLAITDSFESYCANIRNIPVLTTEEEFETAKKVFDESCKESAYRMVVSNLRLVVKIVMDNYKKHCSEFLMDIIQEGNIGLMVAVKKFNPYLGNKFCTYAEYWINAYIKKYIMDNWSIVKSCTTELKRKLFFKSHEIVEDETHEHYEEARKMQALKYGQESLNDNISNIEGEIPKLNMLVDNRPNQHVLLETFQEELELSNKISQSMGKLSERQRYVLSQNIMADEPKKLSEISNELNISRERVRQIKEAGLKKISSVLSM